MATQRDYLPSPDSGPQAVGHHALASYVDVEHARAAVEALERAGIPSAHVSLLGDDDQRAATRADGFWEDVEISGRFERRAAFGVVMGTLVGALLGFVVGGFIFGFPGIDADVGGGIWAATLGVAAAGAAVGFVLGGISQFQASETWETAYQSVEEGRVVVGVHADDGGEIETACSILEGTGPFSLTRYDEGVRGRPFH